MASVGSDKLRGGEGKIRVGRLAGKLGAGGAPVEDATGESVVGAASGFVAGVDI